MYGVGVFFVEIFMKKVLIWLSVVFLFSGCMSQSSPDSFSSLVEAELQHNVELRLGQTMTLKEVPGFSMVASKVLNDSRCPANVQCFTAGQVDVSLDLTYHNDVVKQTITNVYPRPLEYQDLMIRLLSVTPARESGRDIQPADYRFTFRISKKVQSATRPQIIEKPNFFGVIFPVGEPYLFQNVYKERWEPTESDVVKAETVLSQCLQGELDRRRELIFQKKGFFYPGEEENLERILATLPEYRRQYFGLINEYTGEKSVLVNAMHQSVLISPEAEKWMDSYIEAKGGGANFFRVEVFQDRALCGRFSINASK